jgi:NADPH-dependent 2,4-dienoyl-CoA reductase/sulfur reductase-like enzyme
MPQYKYVIVGGGMTADAAVKGIRELDPSGSIVLISADNDPPYNRPPLTKALWKGDSVDTVWRKTDSYGVEMHLGRTVKSIDAKRKQVIDDAGTAYSYDKLLIATGGRPRRFAFGGDNIIYYRTLEDYRHLRALADQKQRIGVIGGGYIGSEIAAGLAMNHKDVVMFMLEETVNGPRFPADLGQFLNDYYRQKGVEVVPQTSIVNVEKRGEQFVIRGRNEQDKREREWVVDGVVAGLGIEPNLELAKDAGLEIDDGIVVDDQLRTKDPDIYAAGDNAAAYKPLLGKRTRIEHEDNANAMGRAAGRNMAGAHETFDYQPFFYSDLFDLGYEAVGESGAPMEQVADWKEPYREGVIYSLKDGRVRGVVLWNVWGKVDAARQLIAEPGPFKPENLKGRIKAE